MGGCVLRDRYGHKGLVEVIKMDYEALGMTLNHYEALMGLVGLVLGWMFWGVIYDAFLK